MKIRRKFYCAKAEPYPYRCPKCNSLMIWNEWQGPFGGWKCPKDGLQIDHKPGY